MIFLKGEVMRKPKKKQVLVFIFLFLGLYIFYKHRSIGAIYNINSNILKCQGKKYYEINLNGGQYDVGERLCKAGSGSVVDYLPIPRSFRYSVFAVKGDTQNKFLMLTHVASEHLYCSDIEMLKESGFLSNNCLQWDDAIVTSIYVENKSMRKKIVNSTDLDYLISLSELNGKQVIYNPYGECSYQIEEYYNNSPIYKFVSSISVINGMYIYENEVKKDTYQSIGTIIEDESKLESIKVDGEQVFTKDIGTTIDNLEYLN